jgi:hypothetical protein
MENLKQFKDMDDDEFFEFVRWTVSNVAYGDIPQAKECAKDYLARGGVVNNHAEFSNTYLTQGPANRLKVEWMVGQLLNIVQNELWGNMLNFLHVGLAHICGGIHPHAHAPGMVN